LRDANAPATQNSELYCKTPGGFMELLHQVMNVFYGVLAAGAIVIGCWLYKKRKDSDR
jgi:hypothetical protein